MHVIQHVDKSYKTLRHSLVSIQISFIVLNPIYLFTLLLLKRSDLESPRTYRPCAYVLYVTLSCFQSANPSEDCSKKISTILLLLAFCGSRIIQVILRFSCNGFCGFLCFLVHCVFFCIYSTLLFLPKITI